jgi:superfamily II DNA helicase RecQ
MAALVRHFGDVQDANRGCGRCDVCDPGGAELRQFRHATQTEREMVQQIVDALRGVDYLASGTLQRKLELVGRISRDEFDALLNAMVRAGLTEIEEAEFEKDGELIRFRKVRLTDAGLEVRRSTPLALLVSDGIVEAFASRVEAPMRKKKAVFGKPVKKADAAAEPAALSADEEALATRLREWRSAEAKRLRVPAYVVLHDRTLKAVAQKRPANPRQLLEIDGLGPAKVEKFGEAILGLCSAG